MQFSSPRNFKSGKYILSSYRLIDVIWLLLGNGLTIASILIYVTFFENINLLLIAAMLLPAGISWLLTLKSPIYQNFYEKMRVQFKAARSQKTYKWEGRNQFE